MSEDIASPVTPLPGQSPYRERQQDDRNMFGSDYQDHDLVFPLPDGTPQRPSNVTRTFTDHVNACHLPVIRLHDMRHGACSLL